MINFPLAHINAYFVFEGTKYEIENFNISFTQEKDFKGQPQHEVKGGRMLVTLTRVPLDNLYLWAKTATLQKSGEVLFQTDLGITILRINFSNAYCINLSREINAYSGTRTTLTIAPDNLSLNGIEHDNFWAK